MNRVKSSSQNSYSAQLILTKIEFPILLEKIRKKIEILDEFKLEYFEIRDEEKLDLFCKGEKKSFRGFISVKVEGIRLIDNLLFKN